MSITEYTGEYCLANIMLIKRAHEPVLGLLDARTMPTWMPPFELIHDVIPRWLLRVTSTCFQILFLLHISNSWLQVHFYNIIFFNFLNVKGKFHNKLTFLPGKSPIILCLWICMVQINTKSYKLSYENRKNHGQISAATLRSAICVKYTPLDWVTVEIARYIGDSYVRPMQDNFFWGRNIQLLPTYFISIA